MPNPPWKSVPNALANPTWALWDVSFSQRRLVEWIVSPFRWFHSRQMYQHVPRIVYDGWSHGVQDVCFLCNCLTIFIWWKGKRFVIDMACHTSCSTLSWHLRSTNSNTESLALAINVFFSQWIRGAFVVSWRGIDTSIRQVVSQVTDVKYGVEKQLQTIITPSVTFLRRFFRIIDN